MKSIASIYALILCLICAGMMIPQTSYGQAKGWCEEKYLARDTSVENRVSYPEVAANGDDVFVVYRQGSIKYIHSTDKGKTWSEPKVISDALNVTLAPAISYTNGRLIVAFPALTQVGELTVYQIYVTESQDEGATWTSPSAITQSVDHSIAPQMAQNEDQVLLLWLETPSEDTLGTVAGRQSINLNNRSPEELFNLSDESGSLQSQQKKIRTTFFVSIYNAPASEFSEPVRIDEIFSQAIPHLFTIYGPINGNFFITVNQNLNIKSYRTTDEGRSWSSYFQERDYFDPGILMDVNVVDNKRTATWIRRVAYQQVSVQFRPGEEKNSTQISPNHYVRSLPRFVYDDDVYHVVWEAGQENDSWITYIRTDKIAPTSEIVRPTSPDLITIETTFAWRGNDNISSTDRLRYSFSYDEGQSWSQIQSETNTTIQSPKDGEYTFLVRSEDVAGNIQEEPASFDFNTFKVAPDTTITNAPREYDELNTRNVEIEFTGEDNTDLPNALEFSARANDQPWSPFTKGETYTYQGLSNGRHTLQVRARDSRGNVDPTPAETSVFVKVGLEVILEVTPELNTNADTVSFAWKGLDDKGNEIDLTYHYELDKQPAKVVEEKEVELQNLEEGWHQFTVWGVDRTGDETAKITHRWLIDKTPPDTVATFTEEFNVNFPIINLEAIDPPTTEGMDPSVPTKFEYSIEEGKWVSFSNSSARWIFDRPLSMFSWGYIVKIRAIDNAGNIDQTPANVDLRIFTIRPILFYSVVGVLVVILIIIIKMLLGRFGGGSSSRPMATTEPTDTSSFDESSSDEMSFDDDLDSDDSFSFDYDDDDEDDKKDTY